MSYTCSGGPLRHLQVMLEPHILDLRRNGSVDILQARIAILWKGRKRPYFALYAFYSGPSFSCVSILFGFVFCYRLRQDYVYPTLTLNCLSSCLSFPNAGIIGGHQHVLLEYSCCFQCGWLICMHECTCTCSVYTEARVWCSPFPPPPFL